MAPGGLRPAVGHHGWKPCGWRTSRQSAKPAPTACPSPPRTTSCAPTSAAPASASAPAANPVIIVNGDSDKYFEQLGLDFDRTPHVWKILVGGTKLSRGFTIEGLTTTYYRRTTQQADTLMQMGRWFGFRPGYRDLVRLYIGRKEALNKTEQLTSTKRSRPSVRMKRHSAPS